MNLSTLKSKILSRMDEVVSSIGGSIPDHYSIDDFLAEGISELLSFAPAYLLPTSSIQNTPVANADGSGSVELPVDCHRLEYFKMNGWKRHAQIIDSGNPLYQLQFNKHLRGKTTNPIAVVCARPEDIPILEYYSLPEGATHTIAKSVYVRKITLEEIETLDEKLSDPLSWIVASLILNIGGEVNGGSYAYKRFTELIEAIRYTTNLNQAQVNNAK